MDWPSPERIPPLEPDTVHVWRVPVRTEGDAAATGADVEPFVAHLTDDEHARMMRFRFAPDRARFATGRGLARVLLGHYVGLSPAVVPLCAGPSGKPALDLAPDHPAAPLALRFNVSHAGEWVLIALARGRDVGVDVEQARPMSDLASIAERFFASGEFAALEALDPPAREAAFFRIWTRKEAFVKATGDGIVAGLDRFTVSIDEDPAVVLRLADRPTGHPGWTIRALSMPTGYAAAICHTGVPCAVRQWQWRADLSL